MLGIVILADENFEVGNSTSKLNRRHGGASGAIWKIHSENVCGLRYEMKEYEIYFSSPHLSQCEAWRLLFWINFQCVTKILCILVNRLTCFTCLLMLRMEWIRQGVAKRRKRQTFLPHFHLKIVESRNFETKKCMESFLPWLPAFTFFALLVNVSHLYLQPRQAENCSGYQSKKLISFLTLNHSLNCY